MELFLKKAGPLHNPQGILNITALAVALPILLLLIIAAVDVIRLPIVMQQMDSSLGAGFDSLALPAEITKEGFDLAAGKDWCALLQNASGCPHCEKESHLCTGAKDSEGARKGLLNAKEQIVHELTKLGFGIFSHKEKNVVVELALYNLIVDDNGYIIEKELVSALTTSKGQRPKPEGIRDHRKLVEKMFFAGKLLRLGIPIAITEEKPGMLREHHNEKKRTFTDIPLVVMLAQVRVKHFFGFTQKLGIVPDPLDKVDDATPSLLNSSVLTAILVRPLARGIRIN